MQDIAPLLQPDRGQAATPLHLVDKKASRTGSRRSPSEHARRCRASRARASSSRSCPTRATAGRRCSASPMSRSSAPGASPRAPRRCPKDLSRRRPRPRAGDARLAARAIPVRRLSREKEGPEGTECCSPTSRRGSRRRCCSPDPPFWSATSSISRPATWVRPSYRRRWTRSPARPAPKCARPLRGARQGFPMVAAVGRAAAPDRAPRLIELEWGDQRHPRIAIVGKGVCFDLAASTSSRLRACG